MKSKNYSFEKVEQVAQVLAEAPTLTPKFLSHESAINELKKEMKKLYLKKNYDTRQIVQLLKQNGIKTTLQEVRSVLKNEE